MSSSTTRNREVHLVNRPHGQPAPTDFALVETDVRPPADGEVLVRNHFMSVDPYMRGRMNDVKSYVPPYQLGEVMDGGAVGVVVETRSPELAIGDAVLHPLGWREYATAPASTFRRVDAAAPLQASLNALGMIGLTAWVGIVDIAAMKEGDTVFVSGAAGAVGSLAGQVARLRGAGRVIGSAGSDEKVRVLVEELGFDAAFNYRKAPVRRQLRDAAPQGIDVYFDNVGGEHLEAAIASMNVFGRVAICGAVSQYNSTEPPAAPRNLVMLIGKRLTLRGFLVTDHNDRYRDFLAEVGTWIADGRVKAHETVVDGIENAPAAMMGMLRGDNTGKMLVRLAPHPAD